MEKTVWSCSLSMSEYLVAGLGAVPRLQTWAVPLFFDGYPIACFTTSCQLHKGLHSFDGGISLHSPIGFFALSGQLAMAAVRHRYAPAILLAAAGRRCPSSDARTNQSLKPYSSSFNN